MIIPTARLERGRLRIVDQTLLPSVYEIRAIATVDGVCEAIKSLRVRGAPALGVAGAYGALLAVEERWGRGDYVFDSAVGVRDGRAENKIEAFPADVAVADVVAAVADASQRIAATRPTAVNLGWAVGRMVAILDAAPADVRTLLRALITEADAIHAEDLAMCRALGAHGAALIEDGGAVLTHCNTGGLATSGFGTALGVVFAAVMAGKRVHVYADETRPLLQGARLTAWECQRNQIPVTVLVDGAAASLLAKGDVSCVIVGADRIAANGDVANKVGTLALAVLARRYDVPFYVAAPSSTIDATIDNGSLIPIEARSADEVTSFAGVPTAAPGAGAYNPAFDVTPNDLVSAIITEQGVLRPPYRFGAP